MILIKGAQIITGTGQAPFKGDILIKDDKISAIGNFPSQHAETVIDGLGLTVTPGFIDTHSTTDHYLGLFSDPAQKDFLLQGITTVIGGQCGSSLAPLIYGSLKSIQKWGDINKINVNWNTVSELKATLKQLGLGVNFGTLAGHSTIRRDLVGEEIRDLTQSELDVFKNSLEKSLQEGALGLSTGLGYSHARHVPYSEIKELLAVIKKMGKVYTTHLRSEYANLLPSVEEAVKIAKETGVTTIISHFRPVIGLETKFQEALRLIENSLQEADLYFQVNPFGISVLPIYTLLPKWAQEGGKVGMLKTINDKTHRNRILEELSNSDLKFENLIIAEAHNNPYIIGHTLKKFSENRNLEILEALLLLMEITSMRALLFYENINIDILTRTLTHPRSLIGSNSASLPESQTTLKPERAINSFPRYLQAAVSQGLPIEEAVRKVTAMPAEIFGIQKRGKLVEGWFADLVMLKDNQVFNVLVNGKLAVQEKKAVAKGSGRPI